MPRARPPDFRAGATRERACRCSRRSPSARSPRCSAATSAVVTGVARASGPATSACGGVARENEALQAPARRRAGAAAGAAGAGRSQPRPRAAARAARPARAADRRPPTIIGAGATPDFRTVTIDKGTRDGLQAGHGGDRAGRRRRPRRRAERRARRRCSCSSIATPRPARSSSDRARRASSSAAATTGCAWTTCRRSPTSRPATSW